MTWRPLAILAVMVVILGGCSAQPNPDCRIDERCHAVLAAALSVVSYDNARVVVIWGRGVGFHAEVHVCYADGRNELVDVMSDDLHPDLNAGVRDTAWDSPPCR